MKYLALLRDSLREAIDNKVLYFTLGMSLLLVLCIATVDFRVMTAKDQAQGIVDTLNLFYWSQTQLEPEHPRAEITEYQQLNEGAEPWNGNYRILLTISLPKDEVKTQKEFLFRKIAHSFLLKDFWWMENQAIKELPRKEGQEIQFLITSRGTKVHSKESWKHDPGLAFGLLRASAIPFASIFQSTLAYSVFWIEYAIVNNLGGWLIILTGIIVTAFFIPNMMEKGSIDLLLVKPIARPLLLLFKYLGGLIFVFFNALVIIGGVWLVLGLRTGLWTPNFLLTILILTFFFAILYSVSVLFGVLTRNSLIALLMTVLVWGALFGIGYAHSQFEVAFGDTTPRVKQENPFEVEPTTPRQRPSDNSLEWLGTAFQAAYTVLPRTNDLGQLTTDLLSKELLSEAEREQFGFDESKAVNVWETVGVSLAFIAVMLGLACWRFSTRDY